jgi:hypothetical protein
LAADVNDLGTTGAVRDAGSLRDVRAALAGIGYRVAPAGALDPAVTTADGILSMASIACADALAGLFRATASAPSA